MKKAFLVTIVLYLTMTSSLYGLEMIDESSIESLRSMPYEEYDSGYGLWDSADLELFVSKDENFSIGLWKSKAGSEQIDTPYPYNVFFLIKSGEIRTKTKEADANRFVSGEGFLIPKGWMVHLKSQKMCRRYIFMTGLWKQ